MNPIKRDSFLLSRFSFARRARGRAGVVLLLPEITAIMYTIYDVKNIIVML